MHRTQKTQINKEKRRKEGRLLSWVFINLALSSFYTKVLFLNFDFMYSTTIMMIFQEFCNFNKVFYLKKGGIIYK